MPEEAEQEPDDPQEPPPQQLQLQIDAERAQGVWSNLALAAASEHEFTVDFIRLDPHTRTTGIVVARVSMSPILVVQLVDLLNRVWQTWSDTQLPKEGPAGSAEEDETTEN